MAVVALSRPPEGEEPNIYVSGVRWEPRALTALAPLIACPPGACHRCCVEFPEGAAAGREEIERIATALGTRPDNMLRRYSYEDGYRIPQPCPFLGRHGCVVHAVRPGSCRLYPLQRVTTPEGAQVIAVTVDRCRAGMPVIAELQRWQEGAVR